MSKIEVGVVGVSGYTGLELVKILLSHPKFSLSYLANSEGGVNIDELHPSLSGVCSLRVEKMDVQECAKRSKLVFLALPHKTAMAFVKPLSELGIKIVDFSADYRLTQELYEEFYCKHTDINNLKNVVYGLPEMFREEIKNANLVANPGCFPTSAILAILPFLDKRVPNSLIIVDAKTGVSGAGKKLSETTHFVNVNENIFAYNAFKHRHEPEMELKLNLEKNTINFVPHLLALTRGMLSSVYLQVQGDFDAQEILEKYYENEQFVRVCKKPVHIKSTAGTNFCDLYVQKRGSMLFISSSIDNLLRGASSQAIVNANLMMGLDENCGIPTIAYVP